MKVSFLICNSGEGSNSLEWFKCALTPEQLGLIEESDWACYSSGGGIQYTELEVPGNFFELNPSLFPNESYMAWHKDNIEEAQ